MSDQPEVMRANFTMEYSFKRSLGPVLSRFVTGLRDRTLLGVKAEDGRVLMPPSEYDPKTGASLDELVEVGQVGTVTTWTWVAEPRPKHPHSAPFAYVLVQLDGADTPMLSTVVAPDASIMKTGMRVRARWAEQRGAGIVDLSFEPDGGAS